MQVSSVLSDEEVWMVACGSNYTAAVGRSGLFTWSKSGFTGRNSALGHGDNKAKPQPTLVEGLLPHGPSIHGVACGKNHMLAVVNQE